VSATKASISRFSSSSHTVGAVVIHLTARCCFMEIAKALVLAGHEAGHSSSPNAVASARHLFPIANRPILFHQLEALRSAGVLEVAIVAPPDTSRAMERAVGDGGDWNLNVRHIATAAGSSRLVAALEAGREFVRDEPVVVQQADALLRDQMHRHIAAFAHEHLDTLALRLDRDTARRAGHPEPGYLLSSRAVEILLSSGPGPCSPIMGVRARGGRVRVQRVEGFLPWHGGHEALLDTNRHLLERIETSYDTAAVEGCRVQGPVVVHPSARVRNSLLRGPLIIGPEARVSDAYIGPYTAIGPGALLEATEIEHSIVLARAELRFVNARLESSIIGEGARVGRGFELPSAMRLSIGNGAEVILR
jgi:glucose-1-phosphate thymidylyltransferase